MRSWFWISRLFLLGRRYSVSPNVILAQEAILLYRVREGQQTVGEMFSAAIKSSGHDPALSEINISSQIRLRNCARWPFCPTIVLKGRSGCVELSLQHGPQVRSARCPKGVLPPRAHRA